MGEMDACMAPVRDMTQAQVDSLSDSLRRPQQGWRT